MTRYKDTDLHEALRRRYANTPQMPTDFTERMMEQMNTKPSHRLHWWYWLPAAACLLIVVGIGLHYELNEASRSIVQPSAHDLSTGCTQSPKNVERAIRILADCETTIQREEQEMRNMVIVTTFRATPQPANAVLVTNETGDCEVIETKRIIEI